MLKKVARRLRGYYAADETRDDEDERVKKLTLNFVYTFWEFMPVKARIWAFLNDREIYDR